MKDPGELEDTEAVEIALIRDNGSDHRWDQRRPDVSMIEGWGVLQCEGGRLVHTGSLKVALIHPRIADDLLHLSSIGEVLPESPLETQLGTGGCFDQLNSGEGGPEPLVSVYQCHLFDDVFRNRYIAGGAPGRHGELR